MLTHSRFKEDALIKDKVNTPSSKHCFQKHSQEEHKNPDIYVSYRGEEVLGTHIYISEMDWRLLAEIDTEEIFSPINEINKTIFYMISGIILISAILVSVGYSISHIGKGK